MKRPEPQQIVDGTWYAVGFGGEPFVEECCECGLTHIVKYKVENGTFWVQYRVDKRATKAARARK